MSPVCVSVQVEAGHTPLGPTGEEGEYRPEIEVPVVTEDVSVAGPALPRSVTGLLSTYGPLPGPHGRGL